ncbi:hypothetical protein L6V77_23225 [Myxococcota bacterium]|nr:hypothetical protein [Myxococcota bacterium]
MVGKLVASAYRGLSRFVGFVVVASAAALPACAKFTEEPVCRPGERVCESGAARFCDDRGRLSVPEICPQGTECVAGTCRSACGNACRPGERRCSPAGPQTCERAALDGCGAWGEPDPCGIGERCVDGTCRTSCPVQCDAGQTRCVGPDAFVTCDTSDACPKWVDWQGCPPDPEGGIQICTGGLCHSQGSCADQCREGEVVCLTEVQSQLCARTAEGCLDWAVPLDCPVEERCVEGRGCGAVCQDECAIGELRCEGRGRQACVRGPDGCTAWGAIEACPGECVQGECAEICQPECREGTRRCGPEGGVEACEPGDDCPVWGEETPCPPGQSCAGEGVCGTCDPGAVERQGCGNCGTQERTCGADRQWTPWGACSGEGECVAGAEEACGRCGVRRCGMDCRFSACEGEGVCAPGETRACGNCGRETCQAQCQWGGCDGQGVCSPGQVGDCNECGHRGCTGQCTWEGCGNGDGTLFRRCRDCGWQFCCPNGDWCNCAAHYACGAGSCTADGFCR